MSDEPTKAELELFRRRPMEFRKDILVSLKNSLVPLGEVMSPVQEADFRARDETMLWLARVPLKYTADKKLVMREMPKVRQFYSQRSRGYSKTSDIALDVIWLLLFCPYKLDGMLVAEDLDQARLMLVQASKITDNNPWILKYIEVQKKSILNKTTLSAFNCWTSDVGSAWGATPDVVVCDEWSHWSDEEWWNVTFSSYAKQEKMLIVGCNACKTGSWQIEKREAFKQSEYWYCSIPPGYAPWFNESTIQQQREGISYLEFQRVWLNKDTASGDAFVEKRFVDAANDHTLSIQLSGSEHIPTYFVAVDYAETKDRTVITASHVYNDTLIIDRMDVIDPLQREGNVILIDEVFEKLDEFDKCFGHYSHIIYVFDKWQMLSVIQKLKSVGRHVIEFEFRGGAGNHQASVLLQQYLMSGKLKWYHGCGEMYDSEGEVWQPQGVPDNLTTEITELITRETGNSKRWRFDHLRNKHDDRAFTVAATLKTVSDLLMAETEEDYYETEEVNGE